VTGPGRGGRNQEVALGAARPLAGLPETLLVSFATDGVDGPTDAAGAVADGTTLARARARGMEPARHLADNNAYPLLDAIGELIRIGPTNTNVNDLILIVCGTPERAAAT
jgi:hydroxypyruvate reductase